VSVAVVTFPETLHIIRRLFDTDQPDKLIRDSVLLLSALDRQSASMFGQEAYPGIHHKAAAVLHGLTKNHALFDGNKRLALMTTLYLYGKNGYWNTVDIAGEYDFMLAVASDDVDSIDEIAEWLAARFTPVDNDS
jgi:death-on-curing protein